VGNGHWVAHCHDPSSPYDNPLMIEPHGVDCNGLVV
jgi:hypothetical protein